MARPPVELNPFGSEANGFRPIYMPAGEIVDNYIKTLDGIAHGHRQQAEAAKAAGQLVSCELFSKASEYADHQVTAAFETQQIPRRLRWTAQDRIDYVCQLACMSRNSARRARAAEDPERAASLQWLGEKQRGMAEAGAFVLDWLHPLPGTEVWIDRVTAVAVAAALHESP